MKSGILIASVLMILMILMLPGADVWAYTWTITTVDGAGDVGAYASIALDPIENPAIAYCASSTDDLKFARLSGGAWTIETVDATGRTGWYNSLAFDAQGNPRIAYWDLSNSALRYARWTGSAWVKETVDNSAYVGQCCSLALDHSGNPQISYYDYTNGDLKYARWDGAAWHIEVLDSGPALMGAGLYTSLVLDSQDHPHISYADHTQGLLRYAWWDGSHWTLETVDGGTPMGTSIQLDGAEVPHISYAYQFGQGSHLKYASRTGPGGSWQPQIVRPGGQKGLYSSIRIRPNGDPCILSWDMGNGIVDFDSFSDGAWTHEQIETMAWTDQWCSLALDDTGRPHAAYRSATEQDLHYALGSSGASVPDGILAGLWSAAPVVFPNPARDGAAAVRVVMERPCGARLRVLDVSGREVAPGFERALIAGTNDVPLPGSLGPGVYYVRIESEGARGAVRFVRTR